MKISALIELLEKRKQEHGDIVCMAWQHPEENDGYREEITSVFVSKNDDGSKEITIS